RARAQGVPPYVVFTDATLKAVCDLKPTSHALLGTVSGVGQRKLADYGDEVVQIVRDHLTGTPAPQATPQERGVRENSAVLGVLRGAVPGAPRPSGPVPSAPPLLDAPPTGSATARPDLTDRVADALRDLRRDLTRETGLSAYVVFTNATLDALASRQPQSVVELADIPGLGPKRLENYGERIVQAIRSVTGD
ncbi:HRDC domain-containing protein, partial [Deinococcus sp. 23YEL01]|uniref:HRDC domain-containing protein n=1 Tax=Deinococcus sp. 23YEL01 TaxID=2745871 RepID=UPI001E2ECACD